MVHRQAPILTSLHAGARVFIQIIFIQFSKTVKIIAFKLGNLDKNNLNLPLSI